MADLSGICNARPAVTQATVLKGHFRPAFLNRIDEMIAAAQDIALKMHGGLVDHLADAGCQPEFGARGLKRQIRQQLETRLAKDADKTDSPSA